MQEVTFLIQRLVRLCHMVIVFLIRRHIDNFIGNSRILRIRLVNPAVRCLNETVLIDSRIGCQRVDQTDVRTLGSLDRAHSSVMGIMYVPNLESCTVTGQTSRSQRRQTSLVGQLAQRIVLIHKLRQLGRSEKLFHRRGYRLDINQGLRGNPLQVLCRHSLANHTLHSGETDTILILKQFAHRTDPAVAQMVDIILISKAIFQMHVVVNGSENVFPCDMLRNQVMNAAVNRIFNVFHIRILSKNFLQSRIIYFFRHAHFLRVHIHPAGDVNHQVGQNFHVALLCLDPYIRNRRVLDIIRQFTGYPGSFFRQDLSGRCIYHILRQNLTFDTIAQRKFFIEFITSDLGKIITARVKEHSADQTLCVFHGQRLAWTDLLIQFQKTFLIIGGCVLGKACKNLRFLAEKLCDLRIAAHAQGTDQNGNRNFSGSVNTDIKYVIGVGLILKPRAAIRNYGTGEQSLTDLIVSDPVIDTGGTHQLTDDNTFRAIDYKGAGFCHQRQVAHENFMLVDLVFFLVVQTHFHLQRCRIGRVALLTLFNRILYFIFTQSKVYEFQAEPSAVIRDRGNIVEDFLHSLVQEPVIGILLNFNQVGHLQDFFLSLVGHSYTFSGWNRTYSVFLH